VINELVSYIARMGWQAIPPPSVDKSGSSYWLFLESVRRVATEGKTQPGLMGKPIGNRGALTFKRHLVHAIDRDCPAPRNICLPPHHCRLARARGARQRCPNSARNLPEAHAQSLASRLDQKAGKAPARYAEDGRWYLNGTPPWTACANC
jgi:hypothetical protein